jgi:hypothetical protein
MNGAWTSAISFAAPRLTSLELSAAQSQRNFQFNCRPRSCHQPQHRQGRGDPNSGLQHGHGGHEGYASPPYSTSFRLRRCIVFSGCKSVMEWSGRAPTLPGVTLRWGDERSIAMSSKSSSAVAAMGIDIGKNSFQHGHDARLMSAKYVRPRSEERLSRRQSDR